MVAAEEGGSAWFRGLEETHALHREHGVHEELEASHTDAPHGAVLVQLHRAEIITEEPSDILEYAVSGLNKVDPGEEVEDQVALDVVCLLVHVQLRVRLADRGASHSCRGQQEMVTRTTGNPPR